MISLEILEIDIARQSMLSLLHLKKLRITTIKSY